MHYLHCHSCIVNGCKLFTPHTHQQRPNEERSELARSVSLLSGTDYEGLRLAGVFSDVPHGATKLPSKYFHSQTAKKSMTPLTYSAVISMVISQCVLDKQAWDKQYSKSASVHLMACYCFVG